MQSFEDSTNCRLIAKNCYCTNVASLGNLKSHAIVKNTDGIPFDALLGKDLLTHSFVLCLI